MPAPAWMQKSGARRPSEESARGIPREAVFPGGGRRRAVPLSGPEGAPWLTGDAKPSLNLQEDPTGIREWPPISKKSSRTPTRSSQRLLPDFREPLLPVVPGGYVTSRLVGMSPIRIGQSLAVDLPLGVRAGDR